MLICRDSTFNDFRLMISDIDRKVKLEKLFDNKKTRSTNSWRVKSSVY